MQQQAHLSVRGFLVLIGLAGLGWFIACYLFGAPSLPGGVILGGIGMEIAKSAFIGVTAGVVLDRALRPPEEPREILRHHGVQAIYWSRVEAASVFLEHVKNPRVKTVSLIGISLRDFLMGNGQLREIWRAIYERLEEEEHKGIPEKVID